MDEVECVVVGAGVIGLAVARALAVTGREVLVLEANRLIGNETSSRNSEVIHAGIYYRAGSLMARHCVAGKRALYAFCAIRGIPHRRCGKLIVATSPEEVTTLASIKARAEANGVDDLQMLSKAKAEALEPNLRVHGAILSPSTGILDSHAYMLALQGDVEAGGGLVAFNSPLVGVECQNGRFVVYAGGSDPMRLGCRLLINAAGHAAPGVASTIAGMNSGLIPKPYYAKGTYFTLSGPPPFSRLIYPVPVAGGLGTHSTVDMAGQVKFGPDVEWVDRIDYDLDPSRANGFYAAIRRYWPDLADGALMPGYTGIRPKIVPPAVAVQDFLIQGPRDHGVANLVNLFGIESPGLTASLAIAAHVRGLLH